MSIETRNETEKAILDVCKKDAEFVIGKNRAYGNSALDPVRIFSSASTIEQLNVRIDDKLSRIMRGTETNRIPEDVRKDLRGYFILLEIAERRARTVRKATT